MGLGFIYLTLGALYFVRACIRSLAKCCWAESVGCVILAFSRHHSTCRSYALIPNDLPHCKQILLIGLKLRFDVRLINNVSFVPDFMKSVSVGENPC